MNFAGPLALTAIFPFICGVVLIIIYFNWTYDSSNMRGPIIDRRLVVSGIALIAISMLTWIAAIWMGFAQAAGVT